MRTTLDIDASLLEQAVRVMGARTKKEAVETALRESVHQRMRRELLAALGTLDLALTLEELDHSRRDE